MESDTHLLYFTKLSGKSQDFYFLVGIHLKHSLDSKSVDVALCKSRLDVVDKNMADVITKFKHIPIKIAMCIKVVKIYIQMKINNLCQYLFLVTPLENKFLAQVNSG